MLERGTAQDLSDVQLATALEALVGACFLAHDGAPVLMQSVVQVVINMTAQRDGALFGKRL